jgi:hypothetical protein
VVAEATVCAGADWYVGPEGKPGHVGTRQSPWDIESAFGGGRPVKPGDTLFVLAGTYRRRPEEQFSVRLAGAEGQPIHVRPAPGERVTIDGGLAVQDPSAHLWIWDFEILVSEPDTSREKPATAGSHPEDFGRPWGGLNIHGGTGCKYINLVIHDCRQGISFWSSAKDSEVHACLIYDNGWTGTDRGHGHAIYTQNQDGVKTISDCIMTGGRSYTMHAYGSSRAYVDNYLVEGNIAYDGGPFLIGGGRPSRNIRVFENYLYNVGMQLGYSAPHNENCEVRDNIIANGGLSIQKYNSVVQKRNVVLSKDQPRPTDVTSQVIVRPNRYAPNRAHVVVYNWKRESEVDVPLVGFLEDGDAFRLLDPRNVFGKPVLEGPFTGSSLRVPVPGEFAAFVLLKAT